MECMFLGPVLELVPQILIECYRFQWAKLQMDQLMGLPCVPDIRDFLGKLPEDLERAYDEILARINSQKGRTPEIARRAFLWMMCSLIPLTPYMLANAVCQDPETRTTNPVDIDINIVLEACRGLLMIDQSSNCRFSHLSVQEYLETSRYSNGQANLLVGTVCLQALFDPTNLQSLEGLGSGNVELREVRRIIWHAVTHWPYHARLHAEECVDDRLRSLVKEFLGSPKEGSAAYVNWSRAPSENNRQSSYVHLSRSSVPAFAVVFFSLNQILSNWWTFNLDVDSLDDEGRSLLHIAGLKGNLTAATELLDLGANSDIQHEIYGSALQVAAYIGSEAVVRLLLDRGASINAQGGRFGNALQAAAAASANSEIIVRLLLDQGADINAQAGEFGNALQAAASRGDEVLVRLLLDKGADINSQGGRFGNALQAAAGESANSEVIVRLLLDKGADINAQGGAFGNALQAAAYQGNDVIVRLLLDQGADINAQGGYFGNALQTAANKGKDAIVRLLLDRGADINA